MPLYGYNFSQVIFDDVSNNATSTKSPKPFAILAEEDCERVYMQSNAKAGETIELRRAAGKKLQMVTGIFKLAEDAKFGDIFYLHGEYLKPHPPKKSQPKSSFSVPELPHHHGKTLASEYYNNNFSQDVVCEKPVTPDWNIPVTFADMATYEPDMPIKDFTPEYSPPQKPLSEQEIIVRDRLIESLCFISYAKKYHSLVSNRIFNVRTHRNKAHHSTVVELDFEIKDHEIAFLSRHKDSEQAIIEELLKKKKKLETHMRARKPRPKHRKIIIK